jgi:dTDP-glucose pyrophosphorylase
MEAINENSKGVAFVCDGVALKGVVTDGNIRRYILKKGDLNAPVSKVTNYDPKFANHHDNVDPQRFMRENSITALPVVNSRHEILSISFLDERQVYKPTDLGIPVVMMAGGKGTRLLPFTNVLPKPLIPVGENTIIEIIMDKFAFFGCRSFDIIVNYKRNLIKAFFDDFGKGYDINFVDEERFNGTGGGLCLIKERAKSTFFMTNCDIVVEEDYGEIIRHHRERKNIITLVTAMKTIPINYGTIEVADDGLVTGLTEKPNISMLVNTGLYVIEPEFLNYIPEDTFIHITDAIEACIRAGERVGAYPVSDAAWFDMGEMDELEKMREHFNG